MSGDATEKNGDSGDMVETSPRGLLTDIATTLSYLSSESRDERRRQKFREALVREYIEDETPSPSILQSVVARLVKPN